MADCRLCILDPLPNHIQPLLRFVRKTRKPGTGLAAREEQCNAECITVDVGSSNALFLALNAREASALQVCVIQ